MIHILSNCKWNESLLGELQKTMHLKKNQPKYRMARLGAYKHTVATSKELVR